MLKKRNGKGKKNHTIDKVVTFAGALKDFAHCFSKKSKANPAGY